MIDQQQGSVNRVGQIDWPDRGCLAPGEAFELASDGGDPLGQADDVPKILRGFCCARPI